MPKDNKVFGRVVKVLSNRKIAINKGTRDGIAVGQRFLIYELTEDIRDFETNEVLGSLEIAKGTGIATHVQERLSLIESDTTEKKSPFLRNTVYPISSLPEGLFGSFKPFDGPEVGDLVKPV